MELFDTHCHLNHLDFNPDRGEARQRAREAGVTRLLCIGFDLASSRSAIELSAWEEMRAAIGIHPESADEWNLEAATTLRQLFDTGKAAAYGEIGLDYHWDSVPRARQSEVFLEQIAFASTLSPTLPLIIHTRDALADTLAVLEASATKAPIVMHCFTGDVKDAAACLDAGCYLGIGGVATFKKSVDLRAAIAYAPLDRLLLETDCPYLAPQYKRGRRNEPSYLPAIAEIVAASKGLTVQEIAEATTETARGLFGM
jgi:TatD DNase family protein